MVESFLRRPSPLIFGIFCILYFTAIDLFYNAHADVRSALTSPAIFLRGCRKPYREIRGFPSDLPERPCRTHAGQPFKLEGRRGVAGAEGLPIFAWRSGFTTRPNVLPYAQNVFIRNR